MEERPARSFASTARPARWALGAALGALALVAIGAPWQRSAGPLLLASALFLVAALHNGLGYLLVRGVGEDAAVRQHHQRELRVGPGLRQQLAATLRVGEAEVVRRGAALEGGP